MLRLCFVAMLAAFLPASAAIGDTLHWRVSLGGTVLGQLGFQRSGDAIQLKTEVNNTPMGVFNGTFEATSQAGDVVRYMSQSRASGKARDIAIDFDGGAVTRVAITPESERTNMSDAAQVPHGVIDPAAAFTRLVAPETCPANFSLFDGRRVVNVTLNASAMTGDLRICKMTYAVTKGPGHLSPFRFKRLRLELTYAAVADGQVLQRLALRVGVFTLRLEALP